MRPKRLIPLFLFCTCGSSLYSQTQPQSDVDSVLKATTSALEQYERLAPGFRCEDAQKREFRSACTAATQTLAARVVEAKAEIVRYRQRPDLRPAELFEVYEKFGRVLTILDDVSYVDPGSFGERNQHLFAEAYNSMVKVHAWFGGVLKGSMQANAKCR